jgi:hypothetical protein
MMARPHFHITNLGVKNENNKEKILDTQKWIKHTMDYFVIAEFGVSYWNSAESLR